MVVFLLSVFAAMATTAVYTLIIYSVDRYEKEPKWLIAAAFIWGAVPSIIAAFLVNTGLSIPFYLLDEGLGDLVTAGAIAPLVEESLKGMALLGIFYFWQHELDSYLDGIIYGAMVGMGFAMVENVYYFMNVYNESGLEAWGINIFLRAIVFGLNHALFCSMTGLGMAIARLNRNKPVRFVSPLVGWCLAVALHAVHNISATLGGALIFVIFLNAFGGVFITFLIIVWALWQEGQWIKKYLEEEVVRGTLTNQQYKTASSTLGRFLHDMSLLFGQGPRAYWRGVTFYEKCAKLAYNKHHYELFEHEEDLGRIVAVRGEIAGISRQL